MIIQAEHIEGYDKPNGCFQNVAKIVRDRGGSAVFGWLISKNIDMETCVHHCVWRTPEGELRDISPQYDPLVSSEVGAPVATLPEVVEFEPDPSATLIGWHRRQTCHRPLEPKYARFVEFFNQAETLCESGDVAGANYWIERADRERHKAHSDRYTGRHSLERIQAARPPKPLPDELRGYLAC